MGRQPGSGLVAWAGFELSKDHVFPGLSSDGIAEATATPASALLVIALLFPEEGHTVSQRSIAVDPIHSNGVFYVLF